MQINNWKGQAMEELLLSPEQGYKIANIGRSNFFAKLKTGEIKSIKVGRLRRIPRQFLEEWIERQITEQIGEANGK